MVFASFLTRDYGTFRWATSKTCLLAAQRVYIRPSLSGSIYMYVIAESSVDA